MNIRLIKPGDFDSICNLWKKINIQPESVFADREKFPLMLKLNHNSCFVAEENGEIVGSIFGLFNGRRAWLHHLGVHPNWQGKGVGSKLLKRVEKSLKQRGAKRVLLSVDLNNLSVQKFYKKYDYTITDDCINLAKNL